MNILLIEDNVDHADIVIDSLESAYEEKANITLTDKLSVGLDFMRRRKFDVCLCDLSLPDSTIDQTIHMLKNEEISAPVVVLTSLEDDDLAVELIEAGIQDFISKSQLNARALPKQIGFAISRHALKSELQQKNADYSTFCYTLSHDFLGALNRISQSAEVLLHNLSYNDQLSDSDRRWLEILSENADSAHHLTLDLYQYLVADGDRDADDPEYALVDIIREIQEQAAADEELSFTFGDLPMIRGHRTALRLVMRNLIENTRKYAGRPVRMDFSCKLYPEGDYFIVTVADSGSGIPKDLRETIFEPFTRGRAKSVAGSGLGLCLVKRSVERFGGSVVLADSPLGGAAFEISLPMEMYVK